MARTRPAAIADVLGTTWPCIDMRATHAILLWKPDGRNADDVTSRAK
jgi:hypothetical protein